MLNLFKLLEFVDSDKNGKTFNEIKKHFKLDHFQANHIFGAYFQYYENIPMYFASKTTKSKNSKKVKWFLSPEGKNYFENERRLRSQDKINKSTYVFTAVLAIAAVLTFFVTWYSELPDIIGHESICPNEIEGEINFTNYFGNYGKRSTNLRYDFEGNNIIGYTNYFEKSIKSGFLKTFGGQFGLPTINYNNNNPTEITFIIKVEDIDATNANFELLFSYFAPLIPIPITVELMGCKYEKDESNVFLFKEKYRNILKEADALFIIIGSIILIIIISTWIIISFYEQLINIKIKMCKNELS